MPVNTGKDPDEDSDLKCSSDHFSEINSAKNFSNGGKLQNLELREIEPSKCKPWNYHNRDSAWLTLERCKELIRSIEKDGQNEPALVRVVNNDPKYEYEIIYGVRRWFACSQIPNRKLLARVTKADDKACMVLMHSENAYCRDITEFERAYSFALQMKSGLFKNQTELADAMGLTQGTISKMIKAAEILEHEWLQALFKNKLDIPIKYAYSLSVLMKDPTKKQLIQNEASLIQKEVEKINITYNSSHILKRLINCTKHYYCEPHDSVVLALRNKAIVSCRRDKFGKVSITIEEEAKQLNQNDVEQACLKAVRAKVYGLFTRE